METHGITLAGIRAFIASRGGAGAFRALSFAGIGHSIGGLPSFRNLTTSEVCELHMKPATVRA